MEGETLDFSKLNLAQIGHNFLRSTRNNEYAVQDLNLLNEYVLYLLKKENRDLKKHKIGALFVCINQNYWPYIKPIVDDTRNFFLPGHEVEIMVWSDIKAYEGVTLFEAESVGWPYPTLMRYHLFLGQEEYLKKFDYLFYIDLDMRMVNIVGDEILGEGLTAAQHPMYAVRKELIPPYEPNENSKAFIKRPGRVLIENGKPRFEPLYFAGGFQGGRTDSFIEAMKGMKRSIDEDFANNYIAIWNDESHWNKYLSEHPPSVVLSPAYVYPDSLINEYYLKVWGKNFSPKIVTLTKPFTLSKEGGAAAQQMMKTL